MSGEQDSEQVDHQEGQTNSVGHSGWGHVHKIFEAKGLFGITEIELNLKTQGIVVGQLGWG